MIRGVGSKPGLQNFSAAAGGGTKRAKPGFEPGPAGTGRLLYHSSTAWVAAKDLLAAWGRHLPLTKNPNCVYLTDCLLAGSGTDWLTVNLSSRCTAEGNRITSQRLLDQSQAGVYRGKRHIPPILGLFAYPTPRG